MKQARPTHADLTASPQLEAANEAPMVLVIDWASARQACPWAVLRAARRAGLTVWTVLPAERYTLATSPPSPVAGPVRPADSDIDELLRVRAPAPMRELRLESGLTALTEPLPRLTLAALVLADDDFDAIRSQFPVRARSARAELRLSMGAAAVLPVREAVALLPCSDARAAAWLREQALVRSLDGKDVVVWRDVLAELSKVPATAPLEMPRRSRSGRRPGGQLRRVFLGTGE